MENNPDYSTFYSKYPELLDTHGLKRYTRILPLNWSLYSIKCSCQEEIWYKKKALIIELQLKKDDLYVILIKDTIQKIYYVKYFI